MKESKEIKIETRSGPIINHNNHANDHLINEETGTIARMVVRFEVLEFSKRALDKASNMASEIFC